MSDADHPPGEHHSLRERLHDRVTAAELAAEEAAGFGPGTAFVEAVEAAANPERIEEGEGVPVADESGTAPSHPAEGSAHQG